MKLIKTKDSSFTVYSDKYNECYHSVSGALEESLKKFLEPCMIRDSMKILDIGFGLGYNIGMAVHKFKNLKIISLEKDILNLDNIKVPEWFEETYYKIRKTAKDRYYKDDSEIKIILGDAVETIKQINEKFDAVFLDPFSPKKNPEMWILDFFKEIKKRMNKNSVLATYSCAGIVRRNLRETGFTVKNGPIVGRRAPGTIAVNS